MSLSPPDDRLPVRWDIAPERARRRRYRRLFFALPYLIAAAGVAATPRIPNPGEYFSPGDLTPHWWNLLRIATLVGMLGTGVVWLAHRLRSAPTARHRGHLSFEDEALVVSSELETLRIPFKNIRHIRRQSDDYALDLQDGRTLALHIDDPLEARRVWDRLLDEPKRMRDAPIPPALARIPSMPGLLWFFFVMAWLVGFLTLRATGTAWATGNWSNMTALPISLAIMVVSGWLLREREVQVGTDGILVRGNLRSRFIPWRDVQEVEGRRGGDVRVRRHKGSTIRLKTSDLSQGLYEEVRRAWQRYRQRTPSPLLEGLARGERPLEQWADAARSGAHQYRGQALRFEELAAVVEDPERSPNDRVAAGLALSGREGGRERIRIAATTSANPEVEALLEAAAEGEVDAKPLERAQRRFDSA